MDKLRHLFPMEIIEAFGWTIIHSIWQAGVIAIVLVILMVLLKNYSAKTRYAIAFVALTATLAWSSATWHSSFKYAIEKTALREAVIHNPGDVANQILLKLTAEAEPAQPKNVQKEILIVKVRAFFQRNFTIIFYLWAIGVIFFLIRFSGNMIYLLSLRKRKTIPPESYLQDVLETFTYKLGIKKKIQLLQSTLVKVPMVLGYTKPVILLPISLLSGLSPKEIEAIIAHELAHIKRYDYIFNIIQSIIETLFFYHPAVWLIAKIIRNEREHSCDDIAIELTSDKIGYIKALAAAESFQRQNYAVAFPGTESGLLHRVKRIQNHRIMKKNVSEGFIAASIIFVSLILLSFTIDNQNLKSEDFLEHRETVTASSTDTIKPKPKPKTHIVKVIKSDQDSLQKEIEKVTVNFETLPEELEQLLEISLSYNDQILSDSIHRSIELALKDFDFEKLKIETIREVDSVMANIKLDVIVKEAMEEAREDIELSKEDLELHKEEMERARQELDNLNLDSIVMEAMKDAQKAMEDINIDIEIKEGLDAAHDALENLDIQVIIEAAMEAAEDAMEAADHAVDHKAFSYKYKYSTGDSNTIKKAVIVHDDEDSHDEDFGSSKDLEQKLQELEEE